MAKKKSEPKAPKPAKEPQAKKPPKPPPQPGELPVGKLAIRKDPRFYATEIKRPPAGHKRIIGLDLGTNCGVSYCDVMPGVVIKTAPVVMGQWDLSLGPYDSGALRFIRLTQFLSILQPDLVMFEDVKFTGTNEVANKTGGNVTAIIARVGGTIEFFGALKAILVTWCEMHGIPCEGIAINTIKAFATGKGSANKEQMILAANKWFGVNLNVEGYERTGTDNIADSAFLCAMGVAAYSEGLTGESKWVGVTGASPAAGRTDCGAAVAKSAGPVGESATPGGVPTPGSESVAGDDLRDDLGVQSATGDDQAAEPAG
jgi:Holliday junction resolvasome RuvABC endonuclease subunit